jgi:hypothetical protein
VTLTCEEEHLGKWCTPKRERAIDTKIVFDLKCHSWYKNTLMAAEIREMNGCWGVWIQLGRDFINFCKPLSMKVDEKKIILNYFLEIILFI